MRLSLTLKTIGASLLIASTAIGAGMLALPLASASIGFPAAFLLMMIMWSFMICSALFTFEVNLRYGSAQSIAYLAKRVLGRFWHIMSFASIVILFYALLAAYISGGASSLTSSLGQTPLENIVSDFSISGWQIIFTLLGCIALIFPASGTDYINRFFFIFKLGFFILLISTLFPLIKSENLLISIPVDFSKTSPYWLAIPVFFTAFGFHGSIPAIVKYIGPHPKHTRLAIISGSLFPILFYTLWEVCSLGTIPMTGDNSFATLLGQKGELSLFIDTLSQMSDQGQLIFYVNFFTFFTVITSFLAVGMGLHDFFKEFLTNFKIKQTHFLALLMTVSAPLFVSLLYPDAFVKALAFAAVALSFLAVIIPSMLVLKMRHSHPYGENTKYRYQVFGSSFMPKFLILFGIGIIIAEVYNLLY